ncbi:MAG TPA: hypothetical protein VHD63_20875, partial [Ktedonobacteraceae bacterium]|nr:hypothetical protein [Ktedonobacteraceae bacterium]
MRQVDGSDLLGQNDPRSAEIGILHVEPEDSRQEILTAINAQELLGRKQIAIVLPEQGKAFRQPVEFDGLKNMRRGLKAQLIFIAPSGPGPAEFARQRRFVVYSSLDTFKTALLSERGLNPRARTSPGSDKKQGLWGRGRGNKERGQNPPPAPHVAVGVPIPAAIPPTPPTPRTSSGAPEPPVTPPTPRLASGPAGQPAMPPGPQRSAQPVPSPMSPMPIEEMDTRTLEIDNSGAPVASTIDEDDDMALPPVTPRQPGGNAPDVQGGGAAGGPRTPDSRRGPTALLIGQQANTPRPGGSGKLPAASAQGSQTRSGTGKQPAVAGRGGAPQGQGRSTRQLAGGQKTPGGARAAKQPEGKNGDTGKTLAIAPAALAAGAAGAALAGAGAQNPPPPPAAAGTPAGPGQAQRQSGLTPLPPPVSRRRRSRGRKRLLLFALLLALTIVLVGWLVVGAGGISGLASLGHLTATVTITPQSQVVQNSYLLTGIASGTPDANQRQVAARVITAKSDTKQGTAGASGSIAAKQAQGVLRFINNNAGSITLASTVIYGNDGVAITFNGPITVPANPPFIDVNAYAVNPGSAGNIKALDINKGCCYSGITVRNSSSFSGGQDAQPNNVITQNDITKAVKSVADQLQASTQAAMNQQVKSNERVIDGSLKCTPTTTKDHNAGDVAKSVTVKVFVTCTEVVFDFAAAQQIASRLLSNSVTLTGYKLAGTVITTLKNSSVVSAQHQASITLQAAGRWVYQFSDQELQQIKTGLVNLSKDKALTQLKQYAGLASANISLSSGSTMPANAS